MHVNILVVDDDSDTRWLVRAILMRAGATVADAPNAEAAFAAMHQKRPDLLVSDIDMPDEDGYSLMQRIRLLEAEAGGLIPSIALTARSASDDHERALRAGFTAQLAKPVSVETLVETALVLANIGGP